MEQNIDRCSAYVDNNMFSPLDYLLQLLSPPEFTALTFICGIAGAVAIYTPESYGLLVSLAILGGGCVTLILLSITIRDSRDQTGLS
jgi:hypothetical protein